MIKWCSVLLLLVLTFFQGAYAADDIGGNAQITYRSGSTKTEHKEKSYDFYQTYNLGVRKDITPHINFTTDLSVNANKSDDTRTTRLFPTFRLNVTNRYFDANAGYQLTEQGLDILKVNPDETRRTTERWNVNLATKSDRYPQIRCRYEEDATSDDLSVHEIDTLSKLSEYTMDYTYQFLNFSGKYYKEIDDNFVHDSTQTTTTKEGRVEFRKSFWANKITSSGSYRWTEQDIDLRGKNARFEMEREATTAWYDVVATPLGIPIWSEEDELVDDRKIPTSPSINLSTLYHTIRVDLNSAEEVALIYLWTTEPELVFDESLYLWDVYYSDDAVNWRSITSSVEFEEEENRFKFSFDATINAQYFRVVNIQNDSTNLSITEIEAFGYVTEDTTDTRQNIIFDAGIRPADWMRITYNFTNNRADTDTELESDTTNQSTHNISVRADADLHRYLKAWVQYQLRLEYDTESDRRRTDTYSLHFDSSPLTTLNASLSVTHSIPKVRSETQSRTTSSLLHISASLLEGLDLSVDGDLHYTDDIVNDTVTFIRTVDSDLRAKLTKALTLEVNYTRNWTTIDNSDGKISGRNSIFRPDIYYRPSRRFYLRGSFELRKDQEGHESSFQQLNINQMMTEKIWLNLSYTRTNNAVREYTYSGDLVWNLSKVFVLRFVYDLSRQKNDDVTKTQTLTSILSAKF